MNTVSFVIAAHLQIGHKQLYMPAPDFQMININLKLVLAYMFRLG